MADDTVVHIGENSPEKVAFDLMVAVLNAERAERSRKTMLDTYAECLWAVKGHRPYPGQ
jgi:hypothetical protein